MAEKTKNGLLYRYHSKDISLWEPHFETKKQQQNPQNPQKHQSTETLKERDTTQSGEYPAQTD